MEIAKIIKGNVRPSEVMKIWAFLRQDGTHGTMDIASMPKIEQLSKYLLSQENRESGSTFHERSVGFSELRRLMMEAKNKKEQGIEDQEIEEEFENIEGIEEIIETKMFPSWEPTKEEIREQRYLETQLRNMCKEENGPLPYAIPTKIAEFGNKFKPILGFLDKTEDHDYVENIGTKIQDGWGKTIERVRKSKNMSEEERQQNFREFRNKIRTPKSKKKRNESTT